MIALEDAAISLILMVMVLAAFFLVADALVPPLYKLLTAVSNLAIRIRNKHEPRG